MTLDDLLSGEYRAVYLALGAHRGIDLGIPGEKAAGVRQGVDFLRELNLSGKAEVGRRVAVVGGGNVAIDVARSAVRLGAEQVNIVYRRTRREMPANASEIQEALNEGVEILYLARKLNLPVREVPVRWFNAPGSSISPLRDSILMLIDIFRVKFYALGGAYSSPGRQRL